MPDSLKIEVQREFGVNINIILYLGNGEILLSTGSGGRYYSVLMSIRIR